MIRKQAETELATMFRHLGYYAHKWRDRGYVSCPSCHRAIATCPYCKSSMLLPKAETKPDYLIAEKYMYVEAKMAKERFAFSDISPTQRVVMEEHESWIFIVIGEGKAPKGREAYLVPWDMYKPQENNLKKSNILSLGFKPARNPSMHGIFGIYQLEWIPKKGWFIPEDHTFWDKWRGHDRPIHTADTTSEPEGSSEVGNGEL